MALKFYDGLGLYSVNAALNASSPTLQLANTSAYVTKTGGRFGDGAVASGDGDMLKIYCRTNQGETCFLGASMLFNRLDTAPIITFTGSSGSTVLGDVSAYSDGRLFVHDNAGNVLGQTQLPIIFLSKWFRIEVKFVPGAGEGDGSIVVHINGAEVINLTGIDTHNGTEYLYFATFNAPRFATDLRRIDDVMWWDATGSDNNDFLGDLRIDELLPIANGPDQSWTPNSGDAYAAVDDPSQSYDDDTTYIAASTVGARSSFAMADLASPSARIMAVRTRARVKKSDAGDTTLSTYITSGGVDAVDAVPQAPATGYAFVSGDIHETDPSTSAPWNDAGINGLTAGVIVSS